MTPVGTTAALNSVGFVNGGDSSARNRAALAQAFEEVGTGARFVVSVNHLKSKGSACDAPDTGDGQGTCNVVRTNAATALTAWLASDPTDTHDHDALIIGDLNSYAMEDPITAIKNAGYTDLANKFEGASAYSYVFDGQWGYLDHALSNAALTPQVTGVADWHINADEPSVLDYNTNFKTANLITSLYAPDMYRVADHDPVLIDVDLNFPPTVDAGGPYDVVEGGSVTLTATGKDPEGGPLSYAWDLDNDGTFETSGQSVTFSAAAMTAPSSYTVKVQVTDDNGQTAIDEATVRVLFIWSGFFQPVDSLPMLNVVKAGSAVPVKFSLGGDKGPSIFAEGYPKSQVIPCDATEPTAGIEETLTAGASSLSYDPATGWYVYAWKTDKSWGGTCRQLVVKLTDGSSHEANFKLTR